MCSIAMPTKLILGHSPPSYGPFLYGSLVVSSPPISNRSVPPRIRPCLSTGSLPINNNDRTSNDSDITGKQKKKVVFADDRGRPLTQVRVMSEPSNMPPLWSNSLLNYLTRLSNSGLMEKTKNNEDNKQQNNFTWQPTFSQPASDYLAFRQKLDKENVCLENVIVRENEHFLIGTIKVRNLAYDKEVILRTSSDSWETHEDVYCSYVEQPSSPNIYTLYDTFRFRLTLPINSDCLEFCVCYRTNGTEYWDNNEGSNYKIKRRHEIRLNGKRYDKSSLGNEKQEEICSANIRDATRVNIRTWSEFASWHHLANDTPYW